MSKADALRIPDYLEHIVLAVEHIHDYVADMGEVAFLNDRKTCDAVARNFEIIGEASRNLERYHAAFTDAHPEVEWAVMYALRNRVSHGYFQVDFELLWKLIHKDLPSLHEAVRGLLESLSKS